MQSVPKSASPMPQSRNLSRASKNCIKFAYSNRKNSSKMLFGIVCKNVLGTDY